MRRIRRGWRYSKYGETQAEYDAEFKKQGKKCVICGRKKKTVALHRDHNHAIAQLPVKVEKTKDGRWRAYNEKYGYAYTSRSKKNARREVLRRLRRKSRRGVICWHCNSGLKKWQQKGGWIDPQHLRNAADYMERWQKKQKWEKPIDV